jgi:hypothetical protein
MGLPTRILAATYLFANYKQQGLFEILVIILMENNITCMATDL